MEQKLLIVDDEAHIRMLIGQNLEELEDEGSKFFHRGKWRAGFGDHSGGKAAACFS
jgi:hypothetical protein